MLHNRKKYGVDTDMGASKGKKLWISLAAVALATVSFLGGMGAVWFSLEPEMRTLIKVKDTIDKEYYFELDDETFYQGVFDGVNGVLDAYSGYMTKDEYSQSSDSLNGKRVGVGVSFYTSSINEGRMRIARISGNSPAEEGGMVAGSYLVAFGKSEETLLQNEDYTVFSAFLMTVSEGETIYLQTELEGVKTTHAVTQRSYVENYVFYRSSASAYGFGGENATELIEKGAPLAALPEDAAYIRLVRFGGNAEEAFAGAMSVFKRENKKHLVLDLRSNGGGYIHTMQGIAAYFCKGATENRPVAAIADYGEKEEYYRAKGNAYTEYFSEDSRICILADSGTASASECLIGVLLGYGGSRYEDICLFERGGVAKTYGKGIMQSYFNIGLSGDVVKLTTAQMRWPVTKNSIHDRGVLPEDGAHTVKEGASDEAELSEAIGVLFG